MSRTVKVGLWCLSLMLATVVIPPGRAQEQKEKEKETAAAPLPAQITSGKKVFISNAPGDIDSAYSGGASRPYDQFYAAMKSWGRYELVGAPADADLVFEISFISPLGTTEVTNGSGASNKIPQIRLVVVDPKTHVPLWWFSEPIGGALRQATRDKNYDEAMTLIVNDVKKMAGQPAAANSGSSK